MQQGFSGGLSRAHARARTQGVPYPVFLTFFGIKKPALPLTRRADSRYNVAYSKTVLAVPPCEYTRSTARYTHQ